MSLELLALIEKAKHVLLTPEQKAQQRNSFAYGNAGFENRLITREMVEQQARILKEKEA
jgi:hypothetical protein